MTDLSGYTKKLALPEGFDAPRLLRYDDVTAHALTRDDLVADVRGVNASLDLISETRGGDWPTGPVTEDENYVDLVWHECEFRDGKSFAFCVEADGRGYIGCAYLYPMGVRQALTEDLAAHDVDVSWWVTPDAYEAGYYTKLHQALQHWTTSDYPFTHPHYSNLRIPSA
ncbi:hypothetical protein AB0C21_06290 [Spirillospora sp. NPDC049024]